MGDVSGARVLSDDAADLVAQGVAQFQSIAQPDEEHDPNVSLPILTDCDGFEHPVESFDLAKIGRAPV